MCSADLPHTGAAVSSMVLRHTTGIAHGFDFYDDRLGSGDPREHSFAERPGDETLDRALAWLDTGEQPSFLWLHLYEPHTPYAPPPDLVVAGQHPYDGEIRQVDRLLARLIQVLKERGLYQRAVIVLTSDHGEGLGDHGEQEHGLFTYRETIHVPLLIKLPDGERAGERVTEPVSLVDIKPTLLHLTGRPRQAGDGLALFADKLPARRPIYSEATTAELFYGWYPSYSIVSGDLHYLTSDQERLFDLATDFAERDNLYG